MFLKYITLFSGFIFFIFSTVLLLKKSLIRRNNHVLGFLFLSMAIYSILQSLYSSALQEKDPLFLSHYVPIVYVITALMGPALYIYIQTLLNKSFSLRSWKNWLHALAILPAIVFNIYFVSLSASDRIGMLIQNYEKQISPIILLNALFYIQLTIYLLISYYVIHKQIKLSSTIFIGSLKIDISWLRTLLIIDLIIMFFSAPFCFYFLSENVSNIISQLAMDIQLFYIFFRSIWQTEIFPSVNISELKSKKSNLKIADEIVDEYFKTLMTFMDENKPYLQEQCSIHTVSEQTYIPVHHLSNILNKRFDKNFPDFINEYRVNEAKKILDNKQSEIMTLEAIGYECGFGSKSSFNKAFKKLTNLTPSEFRIKSKS